MRRRRGGGGRKPTSARLRSRCVCPGRWSRDDEKVEEGGGEEGGGSGVDVVMKKDGEKGNGGEVTEVELEEKVEEEVGEEGMKE